jgi:hypothetical protein
MAGDDVTAASALGANAEGIAHHFGARSDNLIPDQIGTAASKLE